VASSAAPAPPAAVTADAALNARLAAVIDDGRTIWERFDREVRQDGFHPFMPADYPAVLRALVALRAPGQRFLEWGSATGVITILADLLGYEAYGIELDPRLVEVARALAARHGSGARFVAGSLFPAGYRYRGADGDPRTGTLGDGESAYRRLGRPLHDFHVVYGYPWDGEQPVMHDLMRRYGARGARLMMQSGNDGVRIFREGRLER
jgi:SAM-dependent methyltransferase